METILHYPLSQVSLSCDEGMKITPHKMTLIASNNSGEELHDILEDRGLCQCIGKAYAQQKTRISMRRRRRRLMGTRFHKIPPFQYTGVSLLVSLGGYKKIRFSRPSCLRPNSAFPLQKVA